MASPLVVDCSAVIPWFLEDEANAWSEGLLSGLAAYALQVPALWHLEFPNVLLTAERRGRIDADIRQGFLSRAAKLPLNTDTHVTSIMDISNLAAAYGLSTYDAAYLELAKRLNCPLATQDKLLLQAAGKLGVTILA
jgi:predicted nucleic acid-binding protein